jgi:hypothetical protein
MEDQTNRIIRDRTKRIAKRNEDRAERMRKSMINEKGGIDLAIQQLNALRHIDEDYDDLVTFVQEIAFEYTFEEVDGDDWGDFGEWHDALIKQARAFCDAFGLNWEARDFV